MRKPSFIITRQTRQTAAIVLASLVIFGSGGVAGYRVAQAGGPSSVVPAGIRNAKNPAVSNNVNFGVFWQAWNAINDSFYGDATDTTKRLDGAIAGMASSLGDPYTTYFAPAASKAFNDNLQGSFGGIGAELVEKNGYPVVANTLADTPASKVDLKTGDIIAKVGTTDTSGMDLDAVVGIIRGPKGSSVQLTIARSGVDKPFAVSVLRDTIVVASVHTSTLGPNNSISYIKVDEFGQDTKDLFQKAIQGSTGSKGVIIDMRNNPGGYLEAAVSMIGMVVPDQPTGDKNLQNRIAVEVRSKDGSENDEKSDEANILPASIPVVVLVNGYSASAAEIFSGALKDYGRATIVGSQSFGKGSVQNVTPLSNGGSIKITVAHWFTPLGNGIDKKGVTPDVVVALPADAAPTVNDAQMQKALDLLPH